MVFLIIMKGVTFPIIFSVRQIYILASLHRKLENWLKVRSGSKIYFDLPTQAENEIASDE